MIQIADFIRELQGIQERWGNTCVYIRDLTWGAVALNREADDREKAPMPRIVCLCGSTRFWREFQRASLQETLAGKIVLSIGAASGTDDEHFGNLPREEYDRVKAELDVLHLRKIDLADEVLVLNVGGYMGESTRREIAYAKKIGRPVRYLEPQS
jgi:hypothetical protein